MRASPPRIRRSRGFTLIELLVVIAIIAVLMGLLLPAIQKVREAGNRSTCSSQMRQIGIGLHTSQDTYGQLPPLMGTYPAGVSQTGYGWWTWHILPFIEEEVLYQVAVSGGVSNSQNTYGATTGRPVKLFLCPTDPSVVNNGAYSSNYNQTSAPLASYAANLQVFGRVDANRDNGMAGNSAAGCGLNGAPRLPTSFPDGTSKTILIAHKYAECGSYAGANGKPSGAQYPGTNLYTYVAEPQTILGPQFARATFGGGDAVYNTTLASNPSGIGPNSVFQVQPSPFLTGNDLTGAVGCDSRRAHTPHPAGMIVLLGDASVRSLAPKLTGATWWAACTPDGRDQMGTDW